MPDLSLGVGDSQLPIETRLVRCLRLWRGDPHALLENGRSVLQEMHGLLEWHICECIQYGPNNLGGWWSDGVIHLEIDQPANDKFKILGVTWIDCHGVAPFEIDVELASDNDTHFARTIFRIGMLDEHRNPLICQRNQQPSRVLENRPRYNRDWAMAVELMPPPIRGAKQSDQGEPQ